MARPDVDAAHAPSRPRSTRFYRKASPGDRWWFAFLTVPVLVTALVVSMRGEEIEGVLAAEATAALREAGLAGSRVEPAGRHLTLLVPTGEDPDRALAIAEQVDGVADVTVRRVARDRAEARACARLSDRVATALAKGGIPFAGASPKLAPSAGPVLAEVATLLRGCRLADVEVGGHADASIVGGSTLSLRRAEVVKRALVERGVAAARISTKGFGDAFPASRRDTAAARALNNRVTIKLSGGGL